MEAVVKRWGDDLVVCIPASLANAAQITEGTPVTLDVRDGKLVIARASRFPLDALLSELEAGEKLDPLQDWGKPVGTEFGAANDDERSH